SFRPLVYPFCYLHCSGARLPLAAKFKRRSMRMADERIGAIGTCVPKPARNFRIGDKLTAAQRTHYCAERKKPWVNTALPRPQTVYHLQRACAATAYCVSPLGP